MGLPECPALFFSASGEEEDDEDDDGEPIGRSATGMSFLSLQVNDLACFNGVILCALLFFFPIGSRGLSPSLGGTTVIEDLDLPSVFPPFLGLLSERFLSSKLGDSSSSSGGEPETGDWTDRGDKHSLLSAVDRSLWDLSTAIVLADLDLKNDLGCFPIAGDDLAAEPPSEESLESELFPERRTIGLDTGEATERSSDDMDVYKQYLKWTTTGAEYGTEAETVCVE